MEKPTSAKEGRVYCITCNSTGMKYYGSTETSLKLRLKHHEANHRRYKKGKSNLTCSSYQILENKNYSIEEMELVNIVDENDLLKRERYYIESNDCVNVRIPLRTRKEYYRDNHEKFLQNAREWYDDEDNKNRKRAYYQANKERLKAKSLQRYYEKKQNTQNQNE